MGLDTSHNCWHGSYPAFMRWRSALAAAAGLPPLGLMEGFCDRKTFPELPSYISARLPISWDAVHCPAPLAELLTHSDCGGTITAASCGPMADALEALLPKLHGDLGGHVGNVWEKTMIFIDGLRRAAAKGETVRFG